MGRQNAVYVFIMAADGNCPIFGEFDLGRGRVLEPKLGILFGLTDDAPDAVISLNIELKF